MLIEPPIVLGLILSVNNVFERLNVLPEMFCVTAIGEFTVLDEIVSTKSTGMLSLLVELVLEVTVMTPLAVLASN